MDGDKGGRAQLFKPVSLCSDSSITVMSFLNLYTKNQLDDIAVALRVLTTLTERKFVPTDGQSVFFFFFTLFTLEYSCVISGVQPSDSVVQIHVSFLFQVSFPS